MNYSGMQITFSEVPDEISLSFLITGCSLRCKGCHSADSWSVMAGQLLDFKFFQDQLNKHADLITCVLFLGGEWHRQELIQLLRFCRQSGFKTALFTGLDEVSSEISEHLTYLKTGRWIESLGGLDSPITNQKLIEVATGRNIIYKAQGGQHGKTDGTSN